MRKPAIYVLVSVGAAAVGAAFFLASPRPPPEDWGAEILARYRAEDKFSAVTVRYPLPETIFPSELPPPVFSWEDKTSGVDSWLLTIRFAAPEKQLHFLTQNAEWRPDEKAWAAIKKGSLEKQASVAVLGVDRAAKKVLSRGELSILTSPDEVGAPLFYREVNLPFVEAVKDPSRIRWRFGPISSREPPPVVLENLPVCGNCHSFPRDAKLLAMDVDYANSKGSYIIAPVAEQMVLSPGDIFTWDDYKREDGELTFGLLSQISPDGKYVISTLKDKSVFVPKPDLEFSQLFFPIKGILVVYYRETKTFRALPGADDPQYVQSNPVWSSDGKSIVFARTKTYDLKNTAGGGKVLLTPEECREFVNEGKPFVFDLYRIPFNHGQGGKPEPLAGASHDGLSNYFPKFSPDGKWIVFCKAKNYMLLQPDSELYILFRRKAGKPGGSQATPPG